MSAAKPRPVVLGARGGLAVLLIGAGLYFFVHRWHEQVSIVRQAVPPTPDLSRWPDEYAARVLTAARAASRLEKPLQALSELACLYHANGCYREAQQVERGLHALEPRNARWTYFLADTCQNLGDSDGQRMYLEETRRLSPHYSLTRLKLADLLFKQGLIDEAFAHYEWRLTQVPGDPYALLGLARIALARGDRVEGVHQLETIARVSPGFSAAHNLLAGVYERMGDTVRANEQRRLGSSTGRFVEANDPWLYSVFAWCFNSSLVEMLGQTGRQIRQLEASLPFYEKVVRLAPGDGAAYEALGGIYSKLNRETDARVALEAGLAVAPRYPALYSTLTQVLTAIGRKTEARKILERGARLARQANDPTAIARLDQLLAQLPP